MARLAVLFLLPHLALGRINTKFDLSFNNNDLENERDGGQGQVYGVEEDGSKLWVLELADENFEGLRLRHGSRAEENDFDDVVEPVIQSRLRRGLSMRKIAKIYTDLSPIEAEIQNKQLMRQIMKIVNKFALSTNVEPDSYLANTNKQGSTIALYFKGPYTSLIVKLGRNQWHYVLVPSPFPEWFYEPKPANGKRIAQVTEETYVDVPDSIKNEFYKTLLHTVQTLLGVPV